jgi:HD-like signal output (HDOD) protein
VTPSVAEVAAVGAPGLPQPGPFGRYRLLHEIGRSSRSSVWRAHDPRLDRPVVIKLLRPQAGSPDIAAGLAQARAVSRLSHPNILAVFEADEHQGQPYLVFESVAGQTLAQTLHQQPLRPAPEAVAWMLAVLDALDAAHQQGVVHGRLKPANILLGSDGRVRVMDFGQAPPGAAPLPSADIFAAAVLLGDMLCGRPLLAAGDPGNTADATSATGTPARAQSEDLLLPDLPALDLGLRRIVQRALARDPAKRHDSARALHTELQAWLQPDAAPASASSSHATLEFLLRRMRHRTDFPALSNAVGRIQRVTSSESESIRALTAEILLDVALTHKLLRLVNTAHYAGVSAGGIGTVSRAVALVGFARIRNMALSLVLLEHMPDQAHATQLKFEFVRALMAGMVAAELAPRGPGGEDAFLGALFQNLGRLLTEYYLPEEAQQVREQLGSDTAAPATPAARELAAQGVLGIGFDELGAGVARAWGLPEALQRALRTPVGAWPAHTGGPGALHGADRLRWLGRSANELVNALQAANAQPHALQRLAESHALLLGLDAGAVLAATDTARLRLIEAVQALGLELPAGSPARRLIEPATCSSKPPAAAEDCAPGRSVQAESSAAMPLAEPAQALLEGALITARAALADRSMDASELLHLVLDTLHRALNLHHVVLCLRETGPGGRLVGRLGLGPGGGELSAAFRFTPDASATNDLFAAFCARGADLLVADAATVAARLPAWYRRRVDAPTFLLLPLMVNGRAIGLIYADKARVGSLALGEKELALVRALRDQVTLAFGRNGG